MNFFPSKKDIRFLDMAAQQSSNSAMRHKHGSVVTTGGKVVSCGYNYYHGCYLISKCYSTHAEARALHKLLASTRANGKKRKRFNLYVVRISSNGDYVNSEPCENCVIMLKKYNIYKVFYSSCDGMFKVQKISIGSDIGSIFKSPV